MDTLLSKDWTLETYSARGVEIFGHLFGHEAGDFEHLLSKNRTLETYSARRPENLGALFSKDVTETVGAPDLDNKKKPESVRDENARNSFSFWGEKITQKRGHKAPDTLDPFLVDIEDMKNPSDQMTTTPPPGDQGSP